ncbi:MAG: AfsR/SARP family transcriptional regulator, partial [Gemmatimonadaceae bacterium]
MKRLKLLGGASIDDVGGTAVTGRAVQRRRIALLALLATRTRTSNTAASAALIGMSRDKLMAYLWPDAGGERARHLLSDSVYRINHELGGDNASDVIVAVGDELRLDPAALSSDVADFDTATAAGEHARAVELYDGPFLDGFFLSECAELEKWIEQQRARYARDYLASLEALGAAAA